ncbi:integrase [Citrobacter freundii]|nr:integrase [Citrobacter freundii]
MLTDTQCHTAKPKEKLYRLNDFNGLYLEVKPNGKRHGAIVTCSPLISTPRC